MRAWPLAVVLIIAMSPTASAGHVDHEHISWACGFGGSMQSGHPDDCGIDPVGGSDVQSRGEPVWGEAWIDDDERVLTVVHAGHARAVPIKMLDHHEIVNTDVGGTDVAITYCPLCGSGITFDRDVSIKGSQQRLSFAASGFLYNGDLVMWDPQTGTLWNQITGTAIAQLVDEKVQPIHDEVQLDRLPTGIGTWKSFSAVHPDALMLQPVKSSYSAVYSGYSNDPDNCSFRVCTSGDALHPKEMVIGVHHAEAAAAFPIFGLKQHGGLAVLEVGNVTFVAVHHADGTHTTYATPLRFTERADGLHDDPQGRTWDLRAGILQDGSETLPSADALPLFWFAWLNHYPDSALWVPENGTAGALKHDNGKLPGFTIPIVAGMLVLGAVWWRRRG